MADFDYPNADIEENPFGDEIDIQDTLDEGESIIDSIGSDLLRSRKPFDELPDEFPKDADWVRLSFVLPSDDTGSIPLDNQDISNRYFSSAALKHTDTSIGGNTCINPPPQFTRYSDIRVIGLRDSNLVKDILAKDANQMGLGPTRGTTGMGRYYSEAIDDNNQVIHLRFGRPQYNSLTQFFTGFYSGKAAATARAGRFDDGFIDNILRTTGQVIGLAIAPLFLIPMAIMMLGTAAKFFLKIPTSKFYSMRPTMPIYWQAVQGIVNQIGVNMGVVYPNESEISKKVLGDDAQLGSAEAQVNMFSDMLGGEFEKNGTINVLAVAGKSKRLQMRFEKNLADVIKEADGDFESYGESIRKALSNNSLLTKKAYPTEPDRFSLESTLLKYVDKLGDYAKQITGNDDSGTEKDPRTSDNPKEEYKAKDEKTGFLEYYISNEADALDWASFRVDYTGSVNESFSNSVTESSIASAFNSASKAAASVRFSAADGNLTGLPGFQEVMGGVKKVVEGAASVLQIEGLFALAGNAFIDIPKHWESSSANLPKSNYTITLGSPYGNPVSQMFNIYLPLAMLLAGALPLATGKQSYTSPFLCELHDRGRMMTRLGIIDSLSITRGTSNLGFTNEGKALAMEVSFSVLDLSSIMSIPIRSEFSLMPFEGLFDSENAFSDYLMAISGLSLPDVIHRPAMLQRQIKRIKSDFSTYFSAATFAEKTATFGTGLISAMMRGSDKR
jgi:hypothetical protein